MARVFLGLGTNLGDKVANLTQAITWLAQEVGHLQDCADYFESAPWGFDSSNSFLNTVVVVETSLEPHALLHATQLIEKKMGRSTKSLAGYADRIIDIDILLYDEIIMDLPELKIPHPLITERDFVLIPLLQLVPTLVHPQTGCRFSDYR